MFVPAYIKVSLLSQSSSSAVSSPASNSPDVLLTTHLEFFVSVSTVRQPVQKQMHLTFLTQLTSNNSCIGSEVFATVKIHISVFWHAIPCSLVGGH